jgi:hypothetical protein
MFWDQKKEEGINYFWLKKKQLKNKNMLIRGRFCSCLSRFDISDKKKKTIKKLKNMLIRGRFCIGRIVPFCIYLLE